MWHSVFAGGGGSTSTLHAHGHHVGFDDEYDDDDENEDEAFLGGRGDLDESDVRDFLRTLSSNPNIAGILLYDAGEVLSYRGSSGDQSQTGGVYNGDVVVNGDVAVNIDAEGGMSFPSMHS